MNSKAIRKQLLAAVAMVLVAAVALGSSTYAWFVQNTSVQAKTATVSASTAYALLISETGKDEWVTTYEFSDTNTTFAPVSTVGNSAGTAFTFYKQADWAQETDGKGTLETTDDVKVYNVNKVADAETTLYYTKTFDIKASQPCTLYMDDSTVFETVNATGITNIMNKSLRMGIVVTDSSNVIKSSYVYQIDAVAGSTNSYNTTLLSLGADGITKAISAKDTNGTPSAAAINTLPLGGTAGTYTTLKQIGTSGASSALATKPAANTLLDAVNDADALYKFTTANEVCKVTVYIWMEGCDYDCNSSVVEQITGVDNKVKVTLGFSAKANS